MASHTLGKEDRAASSLIANLAILPCVNTTLSNTSVVKSRLFCSYSGTATSVDLSASATCRHRNAVFKIMHDTCNCKTTKNLPCILPDRALSEGSSSNHQHEAHNSYHDAEHRLATSASGLNKGISGEPWACAKVLRREGLRPGKNSSNSNV